MSSVLARQDHGQIQITITIPADQVSKEYKKALAEAAKQVEIPGFRKGKAPVEKVKSQLDENKLNEQVLQQVLPQHYTDAIKEHNLKPIVEPRIEIVNLEEGNDWQVRATTAERPEIKLGDYQKKIKGTLKSAEIWTPDKEKGPEDQKPPEQTAEEKKQQNISQISQWLLKNVDVEVADMIVEQHTNQLLSQLLDQIQKLGLNLEQYLASVNKKVEDLQAEYREQAQQDVKLEFIVGAIGEDQKIQISEDELNVLISSAPNEEIKQQLSTPQQRQQLSAIIFRQKTYEKLIELAS